MIYNILDKPIIFDLTGFCHVTSKKEMVARKFSRHMKKYIILNIILLEMRISVNLAAERHSYWQVCHFLAKIFSPSRQKSKFSNLKKYQSGSRRENFLPPSI